MSSLRAAAVIVLLVGCTAGAPGTTSQPSASASVAATASTAEAAEPLTLLSAGTYARAIVADLQVHATPGDHEPFATLAGQNFYVRGNARLSDDSLWQEIQVPHLGEWVFGWVPTQLEGRATIAPIEPPECPTPEEFALGFIPDAPRRVTCLGEAMLPIQGYLIATTAPPTSPYIGEPAWLADEPSFYLSGAIGSGITSWGLSLHFDPSPAPPSIDPSWISDREGHEGPRVWILGGFGHPSSNECRLTAREPGIADPSPEQARDLCRQRFVVSEIRPGFAERPADANGDLELEACENTEDGYVVRMPGAWFANAAGHIAACRRFSPVAPPQAIVEPDSNAVIDITVFDGSIGFLDAPTYLAFEELTVAGFRASRAEVSEENGKLVYWYELTLGTGAPEMGPTLLAATRESTGGDYVTNKVILDVMMRSLRLPEP